MIAPVRKRAEFTGVDWSRVAAQSGDECGRCGNALLRSERHGFCSRCCELARPFVGPPLDDARRASIAALLRS